MTPRPPVRIANCSGFYGDRLAAAREMLQGPVDVLTGDYLAELTMLILWKARNRDPRLGYATTFLRQMEEVLGTCLQRGIKVVANAGGLNPASLADELAALAARLGLSAQIAYITGDNIANRVTELRGRGAGLANMDTGEPLASAGWPVVTANAYLGGWGIVAALQAGADVVVCPRVADASLASGPAAWWHGWRTDDWDRLAGAVLAGHVIECGPQATGGNYSFLEEIADRSYPGFPIAEIAADGSSVITKHPGTGGLVSVGTVTAQLLYEIGAPAYLNPDVTAHFDTVRIEQAGEDRVALSAVRGSPPSATLKVALNLLGGYRNTVTMVITGLDVEEKAEHARQLLLHRLGGGEAYDEIDFRLLRYDRPDAPTNPQATAQLQVTVKSQDERAAGRAFSDAALELAMGGYAGFYLTAPPSAASAFGIYWPALVPAAEVTHTVHLPDGAVRIIPHPIARSWQVQPPSAPMLAAPVPGEPAPARRSAVMANGRLVPVPLGLLCGARSGDKGGNANVGFWARDERVWEWMRAELTVEAFRELLSEAAGLEVLRYELPNVQALNFVVVGLIAPGVSATTRPDPQAKGLGEYLRSRIVLVPRELAGPGRRRASRPAGPAAARVPAVRPAARHRRH